MPIPEGMDHDDDRPGRPPRLSRRQALRLFGAAVVLGACDRAARRVEGVAATTSSTAADPAQAATTSTLAPTTSGPPITTTTTAAAPTSGALAGFAAFGDSGGGPGQVPVAQAMSRWAAAGHRIDALVTTGDNVYDFGEPHLFAAQLDEPYRELRAAGRPLWVTLGNHDVMRGHGPAQLEYLGLPPLPYIQELPGVRLFFMDGNRPDRAQARWLDEQLSLPGPAFSVVVFHAPIFSCGPHGPHPPLVANWQPVIESRGVSLVLTGHDHLYQRFLSGAGTTYVVTGGGGYALYRLQPQCAPPELQAAAVRHHFTSVEVFPDRVEITAVADDDTILDRTEIPAPVAVPVG